MNNFLSMFLDFMRMYSMHKVTILFPFKPHQKSDEHTCCLSLFFYLFVCTQTMVRQVFWDVWCEITMLETILWGLCIMFAMPLGAFSFTQIQLHNFHSWNSSWIRLFIVCIFQTVFIFFSVFARSHNENCCFGIFDCFRYIGDANRYIWAPKRCSWKWTIYFLVNSIINTLPS